MTNIALFTHVGFCIVLTLIALVGTELMRRYGGIIDSPNQRSSDALLLPRSRGISIVLTLLTGNGVHYSLWRPLINGHYI